MLKVLLSLIVILTSISIVFVWLKVEAAGPFRKKVEMVEILAEKYPKPSSSRENNYNVKPTEKYIEITEAGLLISYYSMSHIIWNSKIFFLKYPRSDHGSAKVRSELQIINPIPNIPKFYSHSERNVMGIGMSFLKNQRNGKGMLTQNFEKSAEWEGNANANF